MPPEKTLKELIAEAIAATAAMSPEARDAMYKRQREGYVRSEMSWPKPKFHYENGVKVYESYEDYCND